MTCCLLVLTRQWQWRVNPQLLPPGLPVDNYPIQTQPQLVNYWQQTFPSAFWQWTLFYSYSPLTLVLLQTLTPVCEPIIIYWYWKLDLLQRSSPQFEQQWHCDFPTITPGPYYCVLVVLLLQLCIVNSHYPAADFVTYCWFFWWPDLLTGIYCGVLLIDLVRPWQLWPGTIAHYCLFLVIEFGGNSRVLLIIIVSHCCIEPALLLAWFDCYLRFIDPVCCWPRTLLLVCMQGFWWLDRTFTTPYSVCRTIPHYYSGCVITFQWRFTLFHYSVVYCWMDHAHPTYFITLLIYLGIVLLIVGPRLPVVWLLIICWQWYWSRFCTFDVILVVIVDHCCRHYRHLLRDFLTLLCYIYPWPPDPHWYPLIALYYWLVCAAAIYRHYIVGSTPMTPDCLYAFVISPCCLDSWLLLFVVDCCAGFLYFPGLKPVAHYTVRWFCYFQTFPTHPIDSVFEQLIVPWPLITWPCVNPWLQTLLWCGPFWPLAPVCVANCMSPPQTCPNCIDPVPCLYLVTPAFTAFRTVRRRDLGPKPQPIDTPRQPASGQPNLPQHVPACALCCVCVTLWPPIVLLTTTPRHCWL